MGSEKLTYPDGSSYSGETIDGKRHGEGTWIRPDGTRYKGQWDNDRPHGQGTIIWPDGKKYTGQWKNGKRHGRGVEIYPDGKKIEGEWVEGELRREKPASPKPQQGSSFKDFEEDFKEDLMDKKHKPEFDLQYEGKSFLAALFDVSMKEMVTPRIIRVLYIIGLIGIGLGVLGGLVTSLFSAFNDGMIALVGAIVALPIGAIIAVIFLRIYMELIILLFNIYDQLRDIKKSLNR